MQPQVSVLLPVHRPRLDYLKQAMQSILQQTFRAFELLIIEAPSEIPVESLLHQLADSRVRHVRFTGQPSLVHQLNAGLKESNTELIARMDADDWCYPERLQEQVNYLQTHPEIAVLGTQLSIMNSEDHPLGYRQYPTEPGDVAQALKRFNALAHPSVMYRKGPVLAAGGYHYDDFPANEDYELWCRLSRLGLQLANLNKTLLRYRIHPGSMKSEKLKNILRGTRLVKRHYYGNTMNRSEWARFYAEGILLNVPGWMIMQLFQQMQYRKESS